MPPRYIDRAVKLVVQAPVLHSDTHHICMAIWGLTHLQGRYATVEDQESLLFDKALPSNPQPTV